MNTFNLTLDLDKRGGVAQWVTLRQGDHNGTELRATIYDHGTQAGGGYTCRVVIRRPDVAEYYRETCEYSSGVATVTIDERYAAAISGSTYGYFELLQGGSVIASTESFSVRILPDATADATVGPEYDSAIEDALAELDEATGRISQMVVDATEEYLEAHPEITTTVQDNSLTDAKLIQHDGILDRVARLWHRLDNLLTATPAESDALTVTDAAKTPLAGLALYGRSTQDGTPTPSAPVAIQSVTPNLADPSSMFNGYPSNSGIVANTGHRTIYVPCEPNTAYTVSKLITAVSDRFAISDSAEVPAGGGACTTPSTIQGTNSDTYVGMRVARTYTTSATAKYLLVWIGTSTTYTEADTAIYLGETYAPYVPYGSVSMLACGKNLTHRPYNYGPRTANGITWTVNADGSVTANGTATSNAVFILANSIGNNLYGLGAGTYTLSGSPVAAGTAIRFQYENDSGVATTLQSTNGSAATVTVGSQGLHVASGNNNYFLYVANGYTCNNVVFRPMLERGSTAHEYVPYAESVTPIPLQGHKLRSLPDGTRDEVTVDQYGHAVLTQRVASATFSGASSEGWEVQGGNGGNRFRVTLSGFVDGSAVATDEVVGYLQCDHFKTVCDSKGGNAGTYWGEVGISARRNNLQQVLIYHEGEALADWQTWLASNPIIIDYALATPVTIDLGTVDPVALQGPDMTAQSVPTAPFALTYERDLNTTLARLEASIADAATS